MNLQVVAEKAGVSVATVSRVLNNRPGVARDKVDRVRKAVKALNFVPKPRIPRSVPSVAPQGLKYGTVAVLVMGDGHIGAAELFVRQLEPICKGLAANGISPMVCMGAETLEEMPPILQKKMVDGILLFGELDSGLRVFFEGIPVFWMTSHQEGSRTVILPGNREIGELGAEYCKQKGCRHLVAISSSIGSEVYQSRHQTFIGTGRELGMEGCLVLGSDADSLEESVNRVIEDQIDVIRQADAIFFPSDRTAAFAYPALHRNGIFDTEKRPVVLSCGGEKNYLSGLDPRPVCIDMCADLIGQQAVEQVLWRIRNPGETRQFSVVIHPQLID